MPISLPTLYQQFIHLSRYSRWLPEEKRRETWEETVDRFCSFFAGKFPKEWKPYNEEIRTAILNLEVMPSMRCLMTAGPALERENVAGYNCSYVAIDSPRAFDEVVYILMNGVGVGFSVEQENITKLPIIAEEFYETDTTIVVADSKLGWAKAFKELIAMLYAGQVPKFDFSRVRPAGSILKVFGGRASGPEPLEALFRFAVRIFRTAKGRKLNTLECHDLVCKIGEIVVVGGVRRAALISLSDVGDEALRHAKYGNWFSMEPQRTLANNSAVYKEKPAPGLFMKEWLALYESKSGERGIFSRYACDQKITTAARREAGHSWGVNPCGEIFLRPREFCNLTEVVVRAADTKETLLEKVRIATIIGTFQSTLTDFKYLTTAWKRNCEEERLLGVSLTGISDNRELNGSLGLLELPLILKELCDETISTNKKIAKKLGIPSSVAITCVKPSGTISQLVDSASGIHARHSQYYVRTVRADNKDPLCRMMKDLKFPYEACELHPEQTTIFSFPIHSPKNSTLREDQSPAEQLELWKIYKDFWCEHNPSMTVSVREEEWVEVGAWVYNHFDKITGVSFLPYSEHVYRQAPYTECSKIEYQELLNRMPKEVEWNELSRYEEEDQTTATQTLACASGGCDL